MYLSVCSIYFEDLYTLHTIIVGTVIIFSQINLFNKQTYK